jgi:thiamine-phosphate pyrophosphorylase
MLDQRLTEGARRVLTDVAECRANGGTFSGFAAHLMISMLADDGRAAALLQEKGISESLLATLPAPSLDSLLDFAEWRIGLLRRADQFAILYADDSLTGTEHLLLALLEIEPGVAEILARQGITAAGLVAHMESSQVDLSHVSVPDLHIRDASAGTLDQAGLYRILDAGANRCREGLRVVEDYVRFSLSDPHLARELKEIRHLASQTFIQLGAAQWAAARDAQGDVGRRGALASERERGALADVVRASLKRVEEAFRSLEEYGKLIDAELSERICGCRYRIYQVEKVLETGFHSGARLHDRRLYLLATNAMCRYGAETVIRNTITTGVNIVQIREKHLSDRELIEFGKQAREWTREAGALLIINDRPEIAAAVGADGVHLGQTDMRVEDARRILGGGSLIGVSTHNLEQAREAVFAGADYVGVGPVFSSQTKEFTNFAGLEFVRQMAEGFPIPWFAIGGINRENVRQVIQAGGTRIAVSGAICGAPHPRGVAAELAEILAGAAEASRTL